MLGVGVVKSDGEGKARRDLMSVFPPALLVLLLAAESVLTTGFLIKKFPASKIKLNRQYKT